MRIEEITGSTYERINKTQLQKMSELHKEIQNFCSEYNYRFKNDCEDLKRESRKLMDSIIKEDDCIKLRDFLIEVKENSLKQINKIKEDFDHHIKELKHCVDSREGKFSFTSLFEMILDNFQQTKGEIVEVTTEETSETISKSYFI